MQQSRHILLYTHIVNGKIVQQANVEGYPLHDVTSIIADVEKFISALRNQQQAQFVVKNGNTQQVQNYAHKAVMPNETPNKEEQIAQHKATIDKALDAINKLK